MSTTTHTPIHFTADTSPQGKVQRRCHGANHTHYCTIGRCDDCGEMLAKIEREGRHPYYVPAGRNSYDAIIFYCFSAVHVCDPERHTYTPHNLLDVIDIEGGVIAAFDAGVKPSQLDESNQAFKEAFCILYGIWKRDLRPALEQFYRLADEVEADE